MSRLIDMAAWDDQRRSTALVREIGRAYVLVADADPARTAACLESVKPFNVGVVIARDGDEAVRVLQRFGSPILLIVDLSLPRKDGFAVIEELRGVDQGRATIIAWSASRGLREFAAQRLAGLAVRVLGHGVAPAVLRAAIEQALRSTPAADTPDSATEPAAAEDVPPAMTELSREAQRVCGTAGVAVYLKAPGDTQFRATVSWTADAPFPHSPDWMPRIFATILETGEALVFLDVTKQPSPDGPAKWPDGVRGLVAVPIVSADVQIVGMICVFDLKPLTFGGSELAALKALGRRASARPDTPPVRPEGMTRPRRGPSTVVGDAGALLDRRGGHLTIARELLRMRREEQQLSVVLFDVDPLKRTDVGEATGAWPDPLVAVCETLTRAIRGSDMAIRWSREELLLVLPGLSVTEARPVAERVRAALQAGARHSVAVSGGLAELRADDTFESVVARANDNVRLARERGHNHVA